MSNVNDFVIGKTGTLTGYIGPGGDVQIPENVRNIGREAMLGCRNIISITIPDGVKEIRDLAFYQCTGLVSVSIPDSVSKVSKSAFAGCFSLQTIQAPDQIKRIINAGEEMDHSAIIERNDDEWRRIFLFYATGYGRRVDFYYGRQKIVYVPDWVNFVGDFNEDCAVVCNKRVFEKFRSSIKINTAFAYLKTPEKYPREYAKVPVSYIKTNGKAIEERILQEDDINLLSAYISLKGKNFDLEALDSLLEVSTGTVNIRPFLVNWKKENYSPKTMEKIQIKEEEIAFGIRERTVSDWKKLWSFMVLEDGSLCLTLYKGDEADVVIPAKIGKSPVSAIGDHVIVPKKKHYNSECLKRRTSIKSVFIPEGIKSIGENAFAECTNLTSVTVPNSLTGLGRGAFHGCSGLADINGLVIVGNVLYNYYGQSSEVVIPNHVSIIDDKAFYGCRNLKKVILPDGLLEIGNGAFWGCRELEMPVFPESLKTVGQEAFRMCKQMSDSEGFLIAKHVLFGYYGNETVVTIPEDVERIDNHVFENQLSIQEVRLPHGVKSLGESAFSGCRNLTKIELPEGLERIGAKVFESCNLTEITIPGSIKTLPYWAFFCCKNLRKVSFRSGVERIDDSAFYGCDNLRVVQFSDSIIEIGNGSFGNCSELTEILLPEYLISIGSLAFEKCNNLVFIKLPDSLDQIGSEAFKGCWKLKNLYIPENVRTIGKDAFGWETIIQGKPGSFAEQYAIENRRDFERTSLPET